MSIKKDIRFMATIIFLAIVATILSVVVSSSGPRVVEQSITGSLAQKVLELTFNTPLNQDSTIVARAEPHISLDVKVQDRRITIRFLEPLMNGTHYSVLLENVSDQRGKKTTISYDTTTEEQSVAYVRRTKDGKDEIHSRIVGKPETDKTLFTHERIGDFALINDEKIIVLHDKDTKSVATQLLIVDKDEYEEITVPKGIALSVTGRLGSSRVLLRTRDMETLQNHLFEYDASLMQFTEIVKPDGTSIHATKAEYGPDDKTILYTDASDGTLYMLDPSKRRDPLPFGSVSMLRRVLPNGSGIFTEAKAGKNEFISSTGDTKILTEDITINEAMMLNDQRTVLLKSAFSLTNPSQQLQIMSNSDVKTIATYSSSTESVHGLNISPNDQYISFVLSKVPTFYDGYRIRPESIDSNTRILTKDGMLIDNIFGTHLQWL